MNAIGTPLTDLINSGTDPIVVNGILNIDATAESEGHVNKHQMNPEDGERTGWCGTGWPNSSREIKFSGANGDRQRMIHLPCSADHGQKWQPYPVYPCSTEYAVYTYSSTAKLQVFKFGYQDSSRPVQKDGMPWGCVAHAAGVLDGILKFFYAR